MEIGRTIRRLRTRKGLKAGELARRLGVSKSYISRIEREHRRVNTDLLEKIGKILEVPPAALLGEAEGEEPQGLWEELEAMRALLLDAWALNPQFIERAVSWLAETTFPPNSGFDTVESWEMGSQEVLGGEDPTFRRLVQRFQVTLSEVLPLNPRPQTPYTRVRERSLAALKGLSIREKTELIAPLLPSLLCNRLRWPKDLTETPPLNPRPRKSGEESSNALRLPTLPKNASEDTVSDTLE
ncbi:MAG: helix-turn-helix domain-containing protein, partial [Planctomycetota bacterium]